jgi:hypothetical protein
VTNLPRPRARRGSPVGLAPLALLALAASGRAQVFDYQLEGGSSETSFGQAISKVGDVDQDGCDDLVVGAPDSGTASQGAVTVYSGKTGAVLLHLASTSVGARFGYAVDGKIDADGDGYPDIVIGAPGESSLAPNGGRVVVYSVHKNMQLLDYVSPTAGAEFGTSVRSLQDDLDGDGIDDFIVGAPGIDTAEVFSGRTGAGIFIKSGQTGSRFGTAVSVAGDLDGDSWVDFVVGSPKFVNTNGNTVGRVAAFAGVDGSRLWTVDGAQLSGFGSSLAHPGDLDGDGRGEVIVGAPYHDDGSGNPTGCATVLTGATGAVLYKVFGDLSGDDFGWSVRSATGDVDGDGVNDFIVGAPQFGGTNVGYARVVSGATGAPLFTLLSHTSDPSGKGVYGSAVTGGDFDGDGRTDVAVGGPGFGNSKGEVEVWTTAVAQWSNYGAGWSGKNGVPSLTAGGNPVVGHSLDVDLSDSAAAQTSGLLLLGLAPASLPTGKGGTLLVAPLQFVPVTVPLNGLRLTGTVPSAPALLGFHLYLQALELDAGASKGWSFTRGLDLEFGFP